MIISIENLSVYREECSQKIHIRSCILKDTLLEDVYLLN